MRYRRIGLVRTFVATSSAFELFMKLALPAKLTALLLSPARQVSRQARKQFRQFFPPRHLFVFGGRTPYWPGFGRDLYAQEPVFRATVQECEKQLLLLGGESLLAHFEGPVNTQSLADEQRVVQFATVIQLALVDLWRAYGVEPDAVMGISNGEPAAVYAAGGLTLTDALRVGISWARINHVEPPVYGTLLLYTDYARAQELCAGCPVGLFVIVVIDPTQLTLFCALTDMEAAKAYLRAQGASFHQIKTAPICPYHTPVLIKHAAVLGESLLGIRPRPTTKPCYLTTTGSVLPAGSLLPWDYWLRPTQQPAYLYAALQSAIDERYAVMTPIGTYPFSYSSRAARKRTLDKVRLLGYFHAEAPELETFALVRSDLREMGLAPK
jgi:acyl transferase domain-containing protein